MNDSQKISGKAKGKFDFTRKIPLAKFSEERCQEAAQQLMEIEPIHDVYVDQAGNLHISYDSSSIGILDIETLLDELGMQRKTSFWWKLKLAWFSYVDENARANACSSGGACCNRPPSANGVTEMAKVKQWHIHE